MSNGTICPDFTGTDLNGEVHNLYSYLDQGISVVVTISATWCGPCWSYHNSGAKSNLYNTYGPPGTGDVQVLFIEGDPATNLACLYGPAGCNNNTQGNWVSGTPYPIIHDEGPNIRNTLTISGYPTVYMISAGNGRAYRNGVGGVSFQRLVDWTIGSFKMEADATVTDAICGSDGEIALTVTAGFGNKTYQWSNGQSSATATNLDPGAYFCTITDANNYSIEVGPYFVGGISGSIVANVVADAQPSCAGFSDGYVTMNAALGNGGFTYLWDDGQTSATKSNIGAGEHYITITDMMGCTLETFAVLSEPLPISASATAPQIPCTEDSGTITITAFGGVGSFLYDLGGAQQTSNVFDDVDAGDYVYTVVDANNCVLSQNISLTEEDRPDALTSTNDTITCVLSQALVSGTGSSEGSNYTYQWTTQNGTIVSGANDINATVSAAGSYTLAVTYTPNGCQSSSTIEVLSDTALPEISTTGGEIDCNNSQALICATVADGLSVEWTINGSTSNDACVNVTSPGNYVAMTTGANGCTATSTAIVTASSDLPVIEIAQPGSIDCNVDEITLNGQVTGGSNFTYNWSTNNGNILSGETSLNPIVNEAGSYMLTVVNEDNGCTATSTVLVNLDTDGPELNVQSAAIDCTNEPVTIAVVVSEDGQYEYSWSTSNGNILDGANSANPTVNETGEYEVVVTNLENGCQSVSSVTVTEDFNTPNPDFSFNVVDNTFNGQASTDDDNSTFLWDFGNGTTSTEANPAIELELGKYNVCLTVTNECGSERKCQEVIIEGSSADDTKYIKQFTIYPNPAKESINLNIDLIHNVPVKATLMTINGVQVISKTYQGSINDIWNVEGIPSGTYSISIEGESFLISRSIIIVD